MIRARVASTTCHERDRTDCEKNVRWHSWPLERIKSMSYQMNLLETIHQHSGKEALPGGVLGYDPVW
ncbi:hypothetical protein WG66_012960 [Moniliophthora roreri]|nr:hypothetical protein WG66_012960 [Moniliophthora roreri]